ncbi:hypothetical protein SPE_0688 [Spiroplasma eriocheiris CCTCC M 207170]|nr:hypothetical protein SPE_0688 [Spiroplasma eriocheiris CCTCC M 207170]
MKKLLVIFGAVGFTVTSASNIIACHHQKLDETEHIPQPSDITYNYEKLSDLAVYLCFFEYNKTTKKFTLRTGDLSSQKIALLEDSEAISEKIWKVLGTKNFMLSKLIYYFADKITALFNKLGIEPEGSDEHQSFSLKDLEIYEFSPSKILMTNNSNPINVNLSWDLKFLLVHDKKQLSINTIGNCVIPFVVLEILLK